MSPDAVFAPYQPHGPSLDFRFLLKCFCIGGNALTALGAFTFPIISPDLADSLQLTQSQLSTIVLAGIIGQYPVAALAGELVDRVGPWACSACGAFLFSIGYGVFAWMIDQKVTPGVPLSGMAFRIMVASYFMLGLGEVFSYFSVIFTAAKDFPRHNGLATGITLALFGLSPLFLSLPSYLFPTPAGYVNAKAYVIFIGTMTTLMHIVSIYGLLPPPPRPLPTIEQESTAPPEDAMNEESLLLPKPTLPNDRPTEPQTWSTVLGDPYFWWVFAITATTIGSAEMVIGNIGTVVTSLLTVTRGSSQAVSNQVQLLSICNTASRLTSGPLIDLLCPNPLILNRRRVVISRFVFIGLGCLLLAVCYGFMGFFVRSNDQTWLLSGSVGIAYGAIWTVLPGVVKLMWGERNFGRNFGILAYAPFFGTTFWTYVFATNVDRESAPGNELCHGSACWQTTFQVCSMVILVAMLSLYGLWRKWHVAV